MLCCEYNLRVHIISPDHAQEVGVFLCMNQLFNLQDINKYFINPLDCMLQRSVRGSACCIKVLPLRAAKRWILMPVPSVESSWERSANFAKSQICARTEPTCVCGGEMQISETEGKTRLHIQQTASEMRVGETQPLMQPMRDSPLSIKSHPYGDLKDRKYTITGEGAKRGAER